ncbi:unnamed protein product [Pleuronectes platessa]|uniref:Uncharacterized protein n=1 Tax=Pleuronectes platessa TaxID=8262 RepID=A0A9N7V3Q8_PLEPL|nr:unnamed protein product [Pleuronectes platessa]
MLGREDTQDHCEDTKSVLFFSGSTLFLQTGTSSLSYQPCSAPDYLLLLATHEQGCGVQHHGAVDSSAAISPRPLAGLVCEEGARAPTSPTGSGPTGFTYNHTGGREGGAGGPITTVP